MNAPKMIYQFLYWIDLKLGKVQEYSYETAPYCGHHYSGHKGWLTSSQYHEGMGEEIHKNWLFEVGYHTDDGYWFYFTPITFGDKREGRFFELLIGSRFTLKPYGGKRNVKWRTIIDFSWLGFHITWYGKRKKSQTVNA